VSKLLITTVRAGGVSRRWRTPGSRPNQPFVSQKAELKTSSDKTRDYYSPLEGGGFEPSVPLCGELDALASVRRGPHAAIVKPGTPARSRRRARRAICGMPGAPSHGQTGARYRLGRLRSRPKGSTEKIRSCVRRFASKSARPLSDCIELTRSKTALSALANGSWPALSRSSSATLLAGEEAMINVSTVRFSEFSPPRAFQAL
jgi:hypothetical protein